MSLPVKTLSLGHCKAAVFQNEQYKSYTVKFQKSYFQKSYKDKQGQWKNTDYFSLPDLRDLHGLLGYMLDKQVKENVPQPKPESKGQLTPDEAAEMVDGSVDDIPF